MQKLQNVLQRHFLSSLSFSCSVHMSLVSVAHAEVNGGNPVESELDRSCQG